MEYWSSGELVKLTTLMNTERRYENHEDQQSNGWIDAMDLLCFRC